MNMPEDFRVEDLDKIKIMHEDGRIGACFGMMFTFYVRDTHEKSVRRRMSECIEAYRAIAKGNLKWFLRPGGGKYTSVKSGQPISLVQDLEKKYSPKKAYSWVFSGGDHYEDASPYGIEMLADVDYGTDDIGFISGNLPMAWIQQNGPGSFQRLMHRWCALLNPIHGYAGLGIIQSIDYDQNRRTERLVFPYAMRFPGLEVENPVSLSLHLTEKIKGVNWLTALCDDLINRIGGQEELKKELGEDFPFYAYDGGCLIQAGPSPQIGDVNRRIIPEHYQKIARKLKPIQVDHLFSFLNTGNPAENKTATKKWLDRFY